MACCLELQRRIMHRIICSSRTVLVSEKKLLVIVPLLVLLAQDLATQLKFITAQVSPYITVVRVNKE